VSLYYLETAASVAKPFFLGANAPQYLSEVVVCLSSDCLGKTDRRQTMGCPQTNNGQYNCHETLIMNPASVVMKLAADQILKKYLAF
jgi:hypothetical protein